MADEINLRWVYSERQVGAPMSSPFSEVSEQDLICLFPFLEDLIGMGMVRFSMVLSGGADADDTLLEVRLLDAE